MGNWGILQHPKYPNVSCTLISKAGLLITIQVLGTVNLNEAVDQSKLDDWEYEEPKKRGDIVLQPQPTDSLNDPLNWCVTFCLIHMRFD